MELQCTMSANQFIAQKRGAGEELLKLINEIVAKLGAFDYTFDLFQDPESPRISLKLNIHSVSGNNDPFESEKKIRPIANKYLEILRTKGISFYTFPEGKVA